MREGSRQAAVMVVKTASCERALLGEQERVGGREKRARTYSLRDTHYFPIHVNNLSTSSLHHQVASTGNKHTSSHSARVLRG